MPSLAVEHSLGVVPYFGLAAGFLTGKYRSPADADGVAPSSMVADYLTDAEFAVVRERRMGTRARPRRRRDLVKHISLDGLDVSRLGVGCMGMPISVEQLL